MKKYKIIFLVIIGLLLAQQVFSQIRFTLPDPAWTQNDISSLNGSIPLILTQLGENIQTTDAFNVRFYKGGPGYSPISRKLWLPAASDTARIIHELAHAFQGSAMLKLPLYVVEGHATALEILIAQKINYKNFPEAKHGNVTCIYSEALNSQLSIASTSFDASSILRTTRYWLASYLWTKILIENPDFLKEFYSNVNEHLNQSNSSLSRDEIISICEAIVPIVEGLNFKDWFDKQYVFNDNQVPIGKQIFVRLGQRMIHYFNRQENGREVPYSGEIINIQVNNFNDEVIYENRVTTNNYGNANLSLEELRLKSYFGKFTIEANAGTTHTTISSFYSYSGATGVFGISPYTEGMAYLYDLDDGGEWATSVSKMGFNFHKETSGIRGRFKIRLVDQSGDFVEKYFNKDASSYFVDLSNQEFESLVTDSTVAIETTPETFSLEQNYPNPFNPATTISFTLPATESVSLIIYDILGRKVVALVDGIRFAGEHKIPFLAEGDLATGVYIYRLVLQGGQVKTKKMLLTK